MRTRLPDRGPIDYGDLARSNDQWPDHRARIHVSGALLAWMQPDNVLDPACGDGGVLRAAYRSLRMTEVFLGDLSRANIFEIRGWKPDGWSAVVSSAEDLIQACINGGNEIDVIVLTEFLEHLEEPEALLRQAAKVARRLLVSSPEMRPGQFDPNPEHLWMFDGEGYEELLNETGWISVQKTHLTFRSMYDFQIWVCDRVDG